MAKVFSWQPLKHHWRPKNFSKAALPGQKSSIQQHKQGFKDWHPVLWLSVCHIDLHEAAQKQR